MQEVAKQEGEKGQVSKQAKTKAFEFCPQDEWCFWSSYGDPHKYETLGRYDGFKRL